MLSCDEHEKVYNLGTRYLELLLMSTPTNVILVTFKANKVGYISVKTKINLGTCRGVATYTQTR